MASLILIVLATYMIGGILVMPFYLWLDTTRFSPFDYSEEIVLVTYLWPLALPLVLLLVSGKVLVYVVAPITPLLYKLGNSYMKLCKNKLGL